MKRSVWLLGMILLCAPALVLADEAEAEEEASAEAAGGHGHEPVSFHSIAGFGLIELIHESGMAPAAS